MRALEIASIGANIFQVVLCLTSLARYFWSARNSGMECYNNIEKFTQWSGMTLHWLAIEITVFLTFLLTMLVMLCKSRFVKVGIDNSK